MKRGADAATKLSPLAPAQLLDHKDSRAIVQATLVRTWAAALAWLPKTLWAGKPVLDTQLRQRYEVKEDAVLSSGNLMLIMAWVLEAILISLMVVGASQRQAVTTPGTAARLQHWAGAWLSARPGITGEVARALTQPAPAVGARLPYVNGAILFADAAMEERACTVANFFLPWGARDIVAIPMTNQVAVRAARELWHADLLRRLASGLPSAGLQRNAQLAKVMQAMAGPVPDTVWEVFEVADPHFARWLLSQPLEARAALARLA